MRPQRARTRPRSGRSRHLAAAAVVVLAGSALTGCGGSKGPDRLTKSDFVETVQAATDKQSSVHISQQVDAGQRSEGVVKTGPEGTSLLVRTPEQGGHRGEIRVVGDGVYMATPPLTPEGKFFRLSKDEKAGQQLIEDSLRMTPTAALEAMEAGMESVKWQDTSVIGGLAVDRYRVTVKSRDGATQGLDVYLTGRHLMRRVRLKSEGHTITMDMTKWGEPTQIDAPPKAALVPVPELYKSLLKAG